LLVAVALTATGCGASYGDVTGKVTYKNKPLTSGSVQLMASDGSHTATIEEDGTYTIKNVPVGEAKVAVSARDEAKAREFGKAITGKGGARGAGADKRPTGVRQPYEVPKNLSLIPEKYGDFDQSNLRVNVERGGTTFNIDLK
jgi:hypothetical protein